MENRTYECAECGGTFTAGWSEEECLAEMKENWGNRNLEEMVKVCDDCYNMMTARLPIAEYLKNHN
jgi:hypothetical protein